MSGKTEKESKKIEIPKIPASAETLLAKAKAEAPKTETPTKRRRGRPPKVKKPTTYTPSKYRDTLICRTINGFLLKMGNSMLAISKKGLPLTEEEKLQEQDCEIGEALCYTIEYYGVTLMHPIMVLIIAIGGFGWQLYEKTGKIKEVQKIKKAEQEHGL